VKFQKPTHHKFHFFLCATSQHSSLFQEVILEQTVYVQSSLVLSIAYCLSLRAKHRGSANVHAATGRQMCFHVSLVCGWNSAVSHSSCWTKQAKIIAVYLTGKAIESSPISGLKRPLMLLEVEAPRISTQ